MILEASKGSSLRPPVMDYAASYGGTLWHKENGVGHPLAILNHAWAKVERQAEDFLSAYAGILGGRFRSEDYPVVRPDDDAEDKALFLYEALIYAVVEFNEVMTDGLKGAFVSPQAKKGSWNPKLASGLRKHSAMICNKLKHNHNRLTSVGVRHLHGRVEGFSVCHLNGEDALVPNPVIHSEVDAFSYNQDMRRMFANCYLLADSVVEEIKSVSGWAAPTAPVEPSATTLGLVRGIAELPALVFPGEPEKNMPKWFFDGDALRVEGRGGLVRPPVTDMKIETRFKGDGHTKTYPLIFQMPKAKS